MGVGVVLLQDGYPITHFSEKLRNAQINFSIYHKELYGIVRAYLVQHHYLLPKEFVVYNDHEALKHLRSQNNMPNELNFLNNSHMVMLHGLPKTLVFDKDSSFSITFGEPNGENLALSSSFQLLSILKQMIRLRVWELGKNGFDKVVNSITSHTHFEMVYGFNPLTPIDLLHFPNVNAMLNYDGVSKAHFFKELHAKGFFVGSQGVKINVKKKKVEQYANKAYKGKKQRVFEKGDLVWVHIRKERSPNLRKSKLFPREDGNQEPNFRINSIQEREPDAILTTLEEEP
ncbi:Retrovirus-related Pol polyprotein, partial [Mucuna pruriens]